jgi:hypothetical protein
VTGCRYLLNESGILVSYIAQNKKGGLNFIETKYIQQALGSRDDSALKRGPPLNVRIRAG